MSCSPFIWLKSLTTLFPNIQPAPRLFGDHASMFYGSDHIKSQNDPKYRLFYLNGEFTFFCRLFASDLLSSDQVITLHVYKGFNSKLEILKVNSQKHH